METLIKNYVSIQGSIGAGKSTMMASIRRYIAENHLSIVEDYDPDSEEIEKDYYLVIDEPLSEWVKEIYSVKRQGESSDLLLDEKEKYSILELFYGNMTKYGFQFQIKAFSSRLTKIIDALNKINKDVLTSTIKPRIHIIAERSLRTDRLFFKNLYDSGLVSHLEWTLYSEFFDIICQDVIRKENMVVYVHTSPEKCHERLNKRHRDSEMGAQEKNDQMIVSLQEKLNEMEKEVEKSDRPFYQQSESFRDTYHKYYEALSQRKKKSKSGGGGVTLEYLKTLDKEHDEMMNELTIPVIRVEFDQDMNEKEIDAITADLMNKLNK
jgi:deoxyadenosine/deoxycytidine kinase